MLDTIYHTYFPELKRSLVKIVNLEFSVYIIVKINILANRMEYNGNKFK